MATGIYLLDHPPARSQYRSPRRERESGVIVVHTAENTPDRLGVDGGAEAVANFIQGRSDPGSYHDLVDSDSIIRMVRYTDEAFQDGTGSNPHAYSVSGATTASIWPTLPEDYRSRIVSNMARAAADYAISLQQRHGITVPARRISREQSEARIPGFIAHAQRDPARRTDPGSDFPWDFFFSEYNLYLNPIPEPEPEPEPEVEIDPMHDYVIRVSNSQTRYLLRGPTDGTGVMFYLPSTSDVKSAAKVVGGEDFCMDVSEDFLAVLKVKYTIINVPS